MDTPHLVVNEQPDFHHNQPRCGTPTYVSRTRQHRVYVRFVGNQDHLQDEPAHMARVWLCTTVQTACSGALWLACEALTSDFPSGCDRASRSSPLPARTRRALHKCRTPPGGGTSGIPAAALPASRPALRPGEAAKFRLQALR